MIIYNELNIKILFTLFTIIVLGLPLNTLIDISFIFITFFILIFFEIKKKWEKNYFNLFIIVLIIFFFNILEKKNIEEAHSVFFSKKDLSILSNFIPIKLTEDIVRDYNKEFDLKRALNSYDSNNFSSEEAFHNFSFINSPFAFSSDNFFTKGKFSRKINNIKFNSRESLRIDQINNLNFNLVFDKKFRRELPYYVFYEIPPSFFNSKICGKGKIYFSFQETNLYNLKDLKFKKLSQNCLVHDKKNKDLLIFGYSINKNDNLEIHLKNNFFNNFLNYFLLILKILFIILFTKLFFKIKNFSKREISIFFLTLLTSIIFIILKDANLLLGLRYYRGGGDGLFHEFRGYEILKNIYNFNYIEALRGGEDTFYFMPGLRYFIALSKIIFGATSYGYIIATILFPLFLYKLLKNIISEKIAFYLLLSFLIFPIFENMGFGYYNYIHQIVRNHAETLSITIIIYCMYKISNNNFIEKQNIKSIFFYCLLLSISTFCRPNFLPTTTLIFLYFAIFSFRQSYLLTISAFIGYSFVSLSLLHNLYFGESFIIFTKSNVHFAINEVFQNLNSTNYDTNIFLSQLYKWNPIYYLHRLLILFFIFYSFFKFEKNPFIWLMITSISFQHIVLLITHPDSRYAYLAWLLTFIMFVYYLFNFYLKKLK